MLVHGAWHGGWCWTRVAERLQDVGHRVLTPTLTGHGDRAHLLSPDIGLDTFVQDIVATLEMEDVTDTILVGHSLAGSLITGAADRIPGQISQLIYLDAALPQNGDSLFDRYSPQIVAERRKLAGGDERRFDLAGRRPLAASASQYRKTSLGCTAICGLSQCGGSRTRCISGTLSATDGGSCISPVSNPFPACRAMHDYARNQPGWQYVELDTGHDAMVLAPGPLADLLIRVAL